MLAKWCNLAILLSILVCPNPRQIQLSLSTELKRQLPSAPKNKFGAKTAKGSRMFMWTI